MTGTPSQRDVAVAGHRGDEPTARAGLASPIASVRVAALGALERLGVLDDATIAGALADEAAAVRRRAAELAGRHPAVDLLGVLHDTDPTVVEVAAWACGEQEHVTEDVFDHLIALTTGAADALVREAAAAALGAIGDPRGLDAVLAACTDKPAVRRRAVLALAAFDGQRVDDAIAAALTDRDWQVRQAAEDLERARRS